MCAYLLGMVAPGSSPTPDSERPLSAAEQTLVRSVFGDAIALGPVRVHARKWWPFQPRNIVMAPRGHIHFHPENPVLCDCFARARTGAQGLFLHEMTHVWQHQQGINLILRRHPFCRYDYVFVPGKPFSAYGIEQQAEIVRHVHLLRRGRPVPGKPPLQVLEAILPFGPSQTASPLNASSV